MKAYLVHYVDSRGPVYAWIEAESPDEITAAFREVVVMEPPPDWATPEHMADFGAYKMTDPLDHPMDSALRQLRR